MRSRSSGSTVPSLSFLHWFGPQFVVPAGASWNSETVCRVRFQNRVGRPCADAADDMAARARKTNSIFFMGNDLAMARAAKRTTGRRIGARRGTQLDRHCAYVTIETARSRSLQVSGD